MLLLRYTHLELSTSSEEKTSLLRCITMPFILKCFYFKMFFFYFCIVSPIAIRRKKKKKEKSGAKLMIFVSSKKVM